ncbi:hypothetical protein ON010_g8292 [Phytophthora cinnamomi]|nr:hypothetical protein ON010_g8292 [Phytophthora cinnamomi]
MSGQLRALGALRRGGAGAAPHAAFSQPAPSATGQHAGRFSGAGGAAVARQPPLFHVRRGAADAGADDGRRTAHGCVFDTLNMHAVIAISIDTVRYGQRAVAHRAGRAVGSGGGAHNHGAALVGDTHAFGCDAACRHLPVLRVPDPVDAEVQHLVLVGSRPGSDHKGHLDAILLGRQGVKAVMKKHNTRPVQTVMGTVAYIPIFILMAYSARDMVRSGNFAGFESGGLLFWKNLMETDSTYILPILAAASTYGNLEVSIRTKSSFWTQVLQVGQYGTIFAVPFLANLPQGVFFYWLGASWSSMAQTIAMNNNDFRRRIGLKPRISQTDSPATAAAEMLGKNVPDATGGATMVETAATTSKQQ